LGFPKKLEKSNKIFHKPFSQSILYISPSAPYVPSVPPLPSHSSLLHTKLKILEKIFCLNFEAILSVPMDIRAWYTNVKKVFDCEGWRMEDGGKREEGRDKREEGRGKREEAGGREELQGGTVGWGREEGQGGSREQGEGRERNTSAKTIPANLII
jgi:hypothetical protein